MTVIVSSSGRLFYDSDEKRFFLMQIFDADESAADLTKSVNFYITIILKVFILLENKR